MNNETLIHPVPDEPHEIVEKSPLHVTEDGNIYLPVTEKVQESNLPDLIVKTLPTVIAPAVIESMQAEHQKYRVGEVLLILIIIGAITCIGITMPVLPNGPVITRLDGLPSRTTIYYDLSANAYTKTQIQDLIQKFENKYNTELEELSTQEKVKLLTILWMLKGDIGGGAFKKDFAEPGVTDREVAWKIGNEYIDTHGADIEIIDELVFILQTITDDTNWESWGMGTCYFNGKKYGLKKEIKEEMVRLEKLKRGVKK